MNTLCRMMLLAILVVGAGGCRSVSPSDWSHPGPTAHQQAVAEQFDPYPENEIGPEIVGARLATFTAMLKAASDALALPSLTPMVMPTNSPAALSDGVPESRPLVTSKDAQAGLLAMVNVNVSPSGSDAAGVNT